MTFAVVCCTYICYFLIQYNEPKEIKISLSFVKVLKLNMSRFEASESSMSCPGCSTLSIS